MLIYLLKRKECRNDRHISRKSDTNLGTKHGKVLSHNFLLLLMPRWLNHKYNAVGNNSARSNVGKVSRKWEKNENNTGKKINNVLGFFITKFVLCELPLLLPFRKCPSLFISLFSSRHGKTQLFLSQWHFFSLSLLLFFWGYRNILITDTKVWVKTTRHKIIFQQNHFHGLCFFNSSLCLYGRSVLIVLYVPHWFFPFHFELFTNRLTKWFMQPWNLICFCCRRTWSSMQNDDKSEKERMLWLWREKKERFEILCEKIFLHESKKNVRQTKCKNGFAFVHEQQ